MKRSLSTKFRDWRVGGGSVNFFAAPCHLSEIERTNGSNTCESQYDPYLVHLFPEMRNIYLRRDIKSVSKLVIACTMVGNNENSLASLLMFHTSIAVTVLKGRKAVLSLRTDVNSRVTGDNLQHTALLIRRTVSASFLSNILQDALHTCNALYQPFAMLVI
jgi:hypothetical protein